MEQAAKALMLLRTEMEQREKRLNDGVAQHLQALRTELEQMHRRVDQVLSHAGGKIAEEARQAVAPATVELDRAVASASASVRGVSKTIWTWFAVGGAILLLTLLVGWVVVGYYRRELAAAKEELGRYENAIPVVRAFAASDAVICDGRVCVNVDPKGKRQGRQGQYRPARARK